MTAWFVQLVPVMWRLHAWLLSGIGISSNQAAHYAKRTAALQRYQARFGKVRSSLMLDWVLLMYLCVNATCIILQRYVGVAGVMQPIISVSCAGALASKI